LLLHLHSLTVQHPRSAHLNLLTTARILNLQAENDTVAPRKFAGVLKAALGERLTVIVIPNAGHAVPEEQPQAMREAIAAFARAL
jgi:pimeloyl-ACP methyl ester carboxylesterase